MFGPQNPTGPPPRFMRQMPRPTEYQPLVSPSLVNDKNPGKERASDKLSFSLAYHGIHGSSFSW